MEGVHIKIEPVDLPIDFETENKPPPGDVSKPEFINVKTEIKEENADDSPTEESTPEASLPLRNGSETGVDPDGDTNHILPENCLEVNIKLEADDSFNSGGEEGQIALPTTSQDGTQNAWPSEMTCPICFKTFANPGNVQRHMLLHAEKKFKCDECPKLFLTQEQLDKHATKHTYVPPEKTYVCDECDKEFKSSSNLAQHKRTHLPVKPYSCPLCHKTFAFKSNLTKHQGKSRCKKPIDAPLQCHVCNKIFEKSFLLKSHLRRHDTDRTFKCDQCSMAFKHKSTLARHIQWHEGIRPYSCPHCDKTFTHSGLLKPHLRVHTGEKPYMCPICKKHFAHKHNMQRHMLRHNKIKHLVCDICHKKFPKESRLKYHMKTHINEKHFACQICPKRFSHKQNVLRHYQRKHPNAKYECKDTDASIALKVWDSMKSKYSEDPGEILG